MAGRSTFGNVRKLPSERWQASYWHEGQRHIAPNTFATKADANAYLSVQEADIRRGAWIDPAAGRERFDEYGEAWLASRHDLRPRTKELYRSELNCHLNPTFGQLSLAAISTAKVREWHSRTAATMPVTAAKCYRLLSSILRTAVEDGKLAYNPCVIKRAGQEKSPERQIPTVEEMEVVAAALPERMQALPYLSAYAGLRLSECLALTRERVDLVNRTVEVVGQVQRSTGGGWKVVPPKTDAGKRTVAIPRALGTVLRAHIKAHVGPEPSALLFTGDKGGPLEATRFGPKFRKARQEAGLDELHFHDLRHLAGTLAARTGATTRELMARLGHANPRAALIYQHATAERDHVIAAGLDSQIRSSKAKTTAAKRASRTQRARTSQV